jgi:hypothetical protein
MHAADFIHSRDEPHVLLTLDMGSISCPTTLREFRKEEGSEDNTLGSSQKANCSQDYLSFVPCENPKIHHDYPQYLNSNVGSSKISLYHVLVSMHGTGI